MKREQYYRQKAMKEKQRDEDEIKRQGFENELRAKQMKKQQSDQPKVITAAMAAAQKGPVRTEVCHGNYNEEIYKRCIINSMVSAPLF